jgi:hypothetical protein
MDLVGYDLINEFELCVIATDQKLMNCPGLPAEFYVIQSN